jgi:hypothetical protein
MRPLALWDMIPMPSPVSMSKSDTSLRPRSSVLDRRDRLFLTPSPDRGSQMCSHTQRGCPSGSDRSQSRARAEGFPGCVVLHTYGAIYAAARQTLDACQELWPQEIMAEGREGAAGVAAVAYSSGRGGARGDSLTGYTGGDAGRVRAGWSRHSSPSDHECRLAPAGHLGRLPVPAQAGGCLI